MEQRLLRKIGNPAIRKELQTLFNNGLKLDRDHLRELLSADLKTNMVQVFPTLNEREIAENIGIDFSKAGNVFLLVKANQGLYWKATELVKFLSENSQAKIVWNFYPSEELEQILKVITISY